MLATLRRSYLHPFILCLIYSPCNLRQDVSSDLDHFWYDTVELRQSLISAACGRCISESLNYDFCGRAENKFTCKWILWSRAIKRDEFTKECFWEIYKEV